MVFDEKVTVSGRTVKHVTCEQCKCDYAYELARQRVAHARPDQTAMSVGGVLFGVAGHLAAGALFPPDDADRARAHETATQGLHKALSRECEPVACPQCGWYQAPMVKEARRRRLRWMVAPAAIVLVLAACAFFFVMSANLGRQYGDGPDPTTLWMIAGVGALGIGTFALRWALISRHNPNALWPRRATPYPGEPAARRLSGLTAAARAATPVVTISSPPPLRREKVEVVMDDAEAVEWYVQRGGEQAGPFSWSQLQAMARARSLYGEDLVYAAEFAEWEPASSIPGLMEVQAG